MYGITLGVNLLLFLVIFPLLANTGGITGSAVGVASSPAVINLEVDIPCPGHAPLVTNELKSLGVDAVSFSFPNTFEIGYNPSKVSRQDILSIDVFESYPATITSESSNTVVESSSAKSGGGCGGSCGSPSCGSGGGGCCGG